MKHPDLARRYGPNVKTATAITKAVRDDINIGNIVIDLLTLLHERLHSPDITPGERVIIDIVHDDVDAAYAMMRDATARRYGFSGQSIDWSADQYIAVVPANAPAWMMPIYQAWRKLAELDYREMDKITLDFACEIKTWLQSAIAQH